VKRWWWILPVVALAGLWACQAEDDPVERPLVRGEGEPRRVFLDRILISYRGNPFDLQSRRSLEEARILAHRLYERARAGEDFVDLRNGYSDDRHAGSETANGPYIFMNYGIPLAPTMPHIPRMERKGMGRRLGDRAFRMQDGEYALVEYHETDYPAGFEVVRCLQRDDRTEEQVALDLKRPN